jgi:hypothetical protein
MKIGPVGAELFHADKRTNGHDEANGRPKRSTQLRIPVLLGCNAESLGEPLLISRGRGGGGGRG